MFTSNCFFVIAKKQKGKRIMNRKRKLSVFVASLVLAVMLLTAIFPTILSADTITYHGDAPYINLNNSGDLYLDKTKFFDSSVIYKLPDSIKETDELSLIIEMPGYTLLDYYNESKSDKSFTSFVNSDEASAIAEEISKSIDEGIELLDRAGISYDEGVHYSTLLRGFEITVQASEYTNVCKALGNNNKVYIGDSYERAEAEVVENNVKVFETGIFNTEGFGYDGSGIVVAVLDTGLDYYHSAFSVNNFTSKELGLTLEEVREIMAKENMSSERLQPGLTAEDVYINEKVPFGFDYADGDSEVFPIRQDHGTHVAGIIAGNNGKSGDEKFTGVAPNAQLAIMKIFSDLDDSARASWIIAALEDCVHLGVDVINMSIGTSCGFSTPSEKELESRVYEKIDEMGMSLIVAASNSFNSAYNSEKNGNLPLTSNPDSATMGSPATYEGALAVGSISGVRTYYLMYGKTVIYFTESSNRVSEEKEFVKELLGDNKDSVEMEYIKIPGVGRSADYTGIDVTGKIALVARGSTTFEDKAKVAAEKGAAAIIVYNNVSGDIKMNVGDVKIPVCSISQDDGELLAAAGNGKIKIAKDQAAGPFMSDFSSWGPGPDLEIKPEITAHGGSIYSSVPGEGYDTISGTSMATPNISGLAALIRQYVIKNFPEDMIKDADGEISLKKVTEIVNRLMMSTADIVLNKNGLPYSVRKQGAGLANLLNCSTTRTYILTYDKDGNVMDKTKIELGDDPTKSGIYTLKFKLDNFGDSAVSYDLSAIVMTEGVSETKTGHGETTVTEEAYILDGAKVEVIKGASSGTTINVPAKSAIDVEVKITLTDDNKKYLDESFENGMYVEGFIKLDSKSGTTIDLSVPYLAFYGDWTVAPLFDLTYFDTNKDELDNSLDHEDKTLADAYATRPIGGIYSDYVSYLGTYYYEQDPTKTQIPATADHISLSNQEDSINSFRYIWGGLLRNAKTLDVIITDDATGEVVYSVYEENIRKSYGDGGPIYPANIEVEFSAIEHNLKNNTKYTVTVNGRLDYGDGGVDTNLNNSFSFPLYTDFQAPAITDVEFYTEYDSSEKENRLFAKVAVYDNHYAMSTLFGYTAWVDSDNNGQYEGVEIISFDKYLTPVYSEYNSTTYVTYELTDYIDEIKANSASPNTIVVTCFDYALNQAIYEIGLPAEYTDLYFEEEEIVLSPYETYKLTPLVYPGEEWTELLEYTSSNPSVVSFARTNSTDFDKKDQQVSNELIALKPGIASVKVQGKNADGDLVSKTIKVTVVGENDDRYQYISPDANVVKEFKLTGFDVGKAFYFLSSDQRDIGQTGDSIKFAGNSYSVKMYPSEVITLDYYMSSYVKGTSVVFESSDESIVEVGKTTGRITAISEGYASVTATVLYNGERTYFSETINIEVKDPYVTSGPTLSNYYGIGMNGKVDMTKDLANVAITEIGQFAFSNFDYTPKTENDIINDENPESTKIWYIGNNDITYVKIPEGVEVIGSYAFAGLTALETVELPSTLKKIEVGAFYNCTKLKTVKGIENVQFFNQYAFANTALSYSASNPLKLTNAVAIGNYAFSSGLLTTSTYYAYEDSNDGYYNDIDKNSLPKNLKAVLLSEYTQSIGAYAFAGNDNLKTVTIGADKLKVGEFAFKDCKSLESISINAAVIPSGAFYNCAKLKNITIGKDVAVIGDNAFTNTAAKKINVASDNKVFTAKDIGEYNYLISKDGKTLLLAAPTLPSLTLNNSSIIAIGKGAFSGNRKLTTVSINTVTAIDDYAFSECSALKEISFAPLKSIGNGAFEATAITTLPNFDSALKTIGNYAFYGTRLTKVVIPDGVSVGAYAFAECGYKTGNSNSDNVNGVDTFKGTISEIVIKNGVTLGTGVFAYNTGITYDKLTYDVEFVDDKYISWYVLKSPLTSLKIGNNVKIGNSAFYGASDLKKVEWTGDGSGVSIGDRAFFNAKSLSDINLSKVISIGNEAFYGISLNKYYTNRLLETGPVQSIVYEDEVNYIPELIYNIAPLANVDLSSLTHLGDQVFAHNKSLTSVKLGESVKKLGYGVFYECTSLEDIDLSHVEVIGSHAFVSTAIKTADLSSVKVSEKEADGGYRLAIGEFAFLTNNNLAKVIFNTKLGKDEYVSIGEGAFSYCEKLTELSGIYNVSYIGDYAFAYTAITAAGLSNAESIGSAAFMKENPTEFKVSLGSKLVYMGDNPFAFCIVKPFETTVTESFNGKDYTSVVSTFDISKSIKVIDGSLYRVVPYGYELITYCGDGGIVNVAGDTVRVSAFAFAGSDVTTVILPYTVNSIGHKAFFGCDKLSLVSFSSYYAPILEEEYDDIYFLSYENIPATGGYDITGDGKDDVDGLGIVDYFMWNAASLPSNVYYGANFVDYIGHVGSKIMMVRPSNGQHYDSFVYGQYFDTFIDGATAADDITLSAIDAINKIPEKITLEDEELIMAAKAAYDKIATDDQKALVADLYQKLSGAINKLNDLKYLAEQDKNESEEPADTNEGPNAVTVIIIVIGSIFSACALGVAIYTLVRYIKAKKSDENNGVNTTNTESENKKSEDDE